MGATNAPALGPGARGHVAKARQNTKAAPAPGLTKQRMLAISGPMPLSGPIPLNPAADLTAKRSYTAEGSSTVAPGSGFYRYVVSCHYAVVYR